jgi:hypothetical protein
MDYNDAMNTVEFLGVGCVFINGPRRHTFEMIPARSGSSMMRIGCSPEDVLVTQSDFQCLRGVSKILVENSQFQFSSYLSIS